MAMMRLRTLPGSAACPARPAASSTSFGVTIGYLRLSGSAKSLADQFVEVAVLHIIVGAGPLDEGDSAVAVAGPVDGVDLDKLDALDDALTRLAGNDTFDDEAGDADRVGAQRLVSPQALGGGF